MMRNNYWSYFDILLYFFMDTLLNFISCQIINLKIKRLI